MYASNHFETTIINLMRQQPFRTPNTLYVGLFYQNPTDTGGSGDIEVNYAGYSRQAITFSRDGDYSIYNNDTITFPESSTSISTTVKYIGIYDSETGTPASSQSVHMWLYGKLTTEISIQANVSPVFRVGAIRWTMSGNISANYARNILDTFIYREGIRTLDPFQPYIGFCTGDPNSGGQEFVGNSYTRFAVNFSEPSTDSDSGNASSTSNTTDVVSPNPATGYWGVLSYAGIYNSLTGAQADTLFASVPLSSQYTMTEGSVAGFREGDLIFSVN